MRVHNRCVGHSLDPERTQALFGRSLLTTHDWSAADLDTLLAVAATFERLDRAGTRAHLLPDELAYAMFFDNSTRTKSAWAGAAEPTAGGSWLTALVLSGLGAATTCGTRLAEVADPHPVARARLLGRLGLGAALVLVGAALPSLVSTGSGLDLALPFGLLLAILMIPGQAYLIPQYQIVKSLNLLETPWAIVLPGIFSAFGTFLMRQAFISLPRELEEAARLDGCNPWQIFSRIMLPLVQPSLFAVAITTVLWSWNDLLWPLIVTTREVNMPLSVGIATLAGRRLLRRLLRRGLCRRFRCGALLGALFFAEAFLLRFPGSRIRRCLFLRLVRGNPRALLGKAFFFFHRLACVVPCLLA